MCVHTYGHVYRGACLHVCVHTCTHVCTIICLDGVLHLRYWSVSVCVPQFLLVSSPGV